MYVLKLYNRGSGALTVWNKAYKSEAALVKDLLSHGYREECDTYISENFLGKIMEMEVVER